MSFKTRANFCTSLKAKIAMNSTNSRFASVKLDTSEFY